MTWTIIFAAIIMGLRHALDPDHLAATLNLVMAKGGGSLRAARVGLSWGIGHSISMLLLGLPAILLSSHLPEWVYAGAEAIVGLVIIYFSIRLFVQLVNSKFHLHNAQPPAHTHKKAFGIGLLHGIGGSYPGALLVLASFKTPETAAIGLVVFTLFTIVSMTLVTAGFSLTIMHHKLMHFTNYVLIPLFAGGSIVFGLWYIKTALGM